MKKLFLSVLFLGLFSLSAYSQAIPLAIQEVDGTPNKLGVTRIKVTNGKLTINGSTATLDLTGNSSMAIGSTVTSGTEGRVLYVGSGPVLAQDSGLTYNDSDNLLTASRLSINGSGASGTAISIIGDTNPIINMRLTTDSERTEVRFGNTLGQSRGGIGYGNGSTGGAFQDNLYVYATSTDLLLINGSTEGARLTSSQFQFSLPPVPKTDALVDLGTAALSFRQLFLDQTITAGATTGNQTINKSAGTVNFAAAATALTVTSDKVTTSSLVFAEKRTNDTTCNIQSVVPGSGSFVINMTAGCASETSVGWWILNQ